MARETPAEQLKRFRRDRRNRSIGEWVDLLVVLGWQCRDASKEACVCKKGTRTLTLSRPHGGDTVVKIGMASCILREIDLAEVEQAEDGGDGDE